MLTLLFGLASIGAGSRAALAAAAEPSDIEEATATVVVDGRTLFRVRGGSSYPPQERADAIEGRIIALARDPAFDVRDLRVVEAPTSSDLMAGQRRIMSVLNADAALEGFDRSVMAAQYQERVRRSILEFRAHRSPAALKSGAIRATIATAVFVASLWALLWSGRRLRALLESRYKPRLRTVAIQTFEIVHAQQIWSAVHILLRLLRVAAVAILSYAYLEYVLSQFPWTRPVA
ncbi:MAG TPA: hypothetical protein VFO35_13050, partial [Steroidobacteraceae bacterium]|nr:hypothetical protein [Steroidobacteraceae bacterium]